MSKMWDILMSVLGRQNGKWSLRVVEVKETRSVISFEITDEKSAKYTKELVMTFVQGILVTYRLICQKTGASPFRLTLESTEDLTSKNMRLLEVLQNFPIHEFKVTVNGAVIMPVRGNIFNCTSIVELADTAMWKQYEAYRTKNVDKDALNTLRQYVHDMDSNIIYVYLRNDTKELVIKGSTWLNLDVRKMWSEKEGLFSIPDNAEGGSGGGCRQLCERVTSDEVLLICRCSCRYKLYCYSRYDFLC